ncbi:MAG TPA: ABC transporter permease [Candidatus Acidoferrales bacterium]|nr:ABC transporter permease [Candidatus Acidoferrales bacterium]
MNDFKYALRMIGRARTLSATIIVTVAVAISANASIFSVVNAVLLRPLPFREPSRLVQVAEKNDKLSLPTFGSSSLNFLSWREQEQSFEELAAIGFNNYTMTGVGEPEQFVGNTISPGLMRVLGLSPVAGRAFRDAEGNLGAAPVAMVGEATWKRRFGSDPSLIGQTLALNGVPTMIVGIAPESLNLFSAGEIYTPLVIDPSKENRLSHQIFTVGRLKNGVSMSQAQAEMNAVAEGVGRRYPEVRDWGIHLVSFFDTFVGSDLKRALLVLLCAVFCLLLIACANIANLLLARSASRRSEMAVRTAVGAPRKRLVRQLLIEGIGLSLCGGAIGFVIALFAINAINRYLPANTLPVPIIHLDLTVLFFALGLTLTTGIIFGILPAWEASRTDIHALLRQTGRTSFGSLGARVRNTLIAGQLALATILLIGAFLFIRTVSNLQRVHLGFDSQRLITFQLSPPAAKYSAGKSSQLYRNLIDSLQSLPGVTAAAVCSGIPFGAGAYNTHPMLPVGQSMLPPGTLVPIDWRVVSPGYFKTMGIPLLRGRDFTDADGGTPSSTQVTIVSQATAKKFWGESDPLGHGLSRSAERNIVFTVIGVVGDVRSTALNQESPALYYPTTWRMWPVMDVAVRSKASTEMLLPAIRQKVHELDPDLALANTRTMDEWIANRIAEPRLNSVLLGIFSAVAMIIAVVGIYGGLAYSVSQRTREIGLRMALGANPPSIVRLIVLQGMGVAIAGVASGLLGAVWLGRAAAALLYGVSVRDPMTYGVVALVLTLVAFVACAVPALRAARLDPLSALRE